MISLIEAVYGLKSYQVQAPGWMEQERFDISAETQHPATESQMNAMLREFLPRRFGLVTHRSTQSVNVYSLEPANSGSKLEPAPGSASYVRVGIRYPSGATIQGTGPITELTSMLTRARLLVSYRSAGTGCTASLTWRWFQRLDRFSAGCFMTLSSMISRVHGILAQL